VPLADTPTVEIHVALRYPNGRIYETVYDTTQPMHNGAEFAMHGRTWRVIGLAEKPRANVPPAQERRILCVASDS
jgi:hypothetical protein